MAEDSDGKITKLTIQIVTKKKKQESSSGTKEKKEVPDFDNPGGKTLEAQFNPENFALTYESETTKEAEGGAKTVNTQSKKNSNENQAAAAVTKPNTLSFKLVYDACYTDSPNIKEKVDFLNSLFYQKDSAVTPPVVITYGQVINFHGMPTKLTMTYALFSNDGSPVRVIADLEFKGSNMTSLDGKKREALTFEDTTGSSDSLSDFAAKKMKDAALYTAVAKANKLPNLMKLSPGAKLKVPGVK